MINIVELVFWGLIALLVLLVAIQLICRPRRRQ